MSTTGRRRNGSQASCEPCRRGKTRCDHQKPICAGCRRRGLEAQCWYHPAPLTKQRGSQRPTPPTPTAQNAVEQGGLMGSVSTCRDAADRNDSAERAPKFHTWPFILNDANGATSQALIHEIHDKKAYEERLAATEEIVSELRFLALIEKLLHEWLSYSQVALGPRPLILQLVAGIRTDPATSGCVSEDTADYVHNVTQLAKDVLRSSSSEVAVAPSLDLEGFCALFSGANLRVETLGLLYTTAARSYLARADADERRHDLFTRGMIRCSNLSLRLARDLAAQTNDLIIWLAHENLQLTTLLEGDASLSVWRRLGGLATDLFALGLHREATYSAETTPFFLAECRRKTFASAYHLDKVFAAVFDRPPRMPTRHADCKLPLDLSDDELFANAPEMLEQARSNLTPDGWNPDGGYRTTTWARIRYILGVFQEETVEYRFRSAQSIDDADLRLTCLRDLSGRCHQAWNSLPRHLRYRPDCWTSNLPSPVCLMLGKVYLSYLHIDFQIYRLLGKGRTTPQPELLRVSASMLETVLQMANAARNRASFTPRDLPGIILCYGVPSAAILTTALQEATRDSSRSLPSGVNSSLLIRNLSVVVSQLESVSSPGESNRVPCIQASKVISRKLDQILDSLAVSAAVMPSNDALGVENSSAESMSTRLPPASSTPAMGLADLDTFVDFDTLDLETWALNVDLGATNGEWDLF
ncbi:hypothetical protein QBC46DRAFT_426569 [Diplogelasinospora grovesii]|uniref:Zn(2)-C6 fungal-type domain-containing protein n=1 Tax=Diplogelasinospora grovesii TaxID=303347 RepID=A0AAN6MWH0_9PEZI|nr:hypothetical protein QBC46DRAFT_426569 [Diplogelasinospora grovesii]